MLTKTIATRLGTLAAAALLAGCAAQPEPIIDYDAPLGKLSDVRSSAIQVPQDLCEFSPIPDDLAAQLRGRSDFDEIVAYLLENCPEAGLALADVATGSTRGGLQGGNGDGPERVFKIPGQDPKDPPNGGPKDPPNGDPKDPPNGDPKDPPKEWPDKEWPKDPEKQWPIDPQKEQPDTDPEVL